MRFGKLELSGGFLLLGALLYYLDQDGIVAASLFFCFLHELGHYVIIRAFGGDVRKISVTVIGAEMVLRGRMSYLGDMLSALSGPAVNLVLALLLCRNERWILYAGVNLALALFNLLPLSCLDGGKFLAGLLSFCFGPQQAVATGEWIDRLLGGVLLFGGVFLLGSCGNFTLLLVSLWFLRKNGLGWKRSCQTRQKRVQ